MRYRPKTLFACVFTLLYGALTTPFAFADDAPKAAPTLGDSLLLHVVCTSPDGDCSGVSLYDKSGNEIVDYLAQGSSTLDLPDAYANGGPITAKIHSLGVPFTLCTVDFDPKTAQYCEFDIDFVESMIKVVINKCEMGCYQ